MDLEIKNAVGSGFFFWQFLETEKIYYSEASTVKVDIPNIKLCDQTVKLKISAEDSSGKTTHKIIPLNISQTWCTYKAKENALLSNVITKLALDKKGKLWIGTDKGLGSFHDGQWSHVYQDAVKYSESTLTLLFAECSDSAHVLQ